MGIPRAETTSIGSHYAEHVAELMARHDRALATVGADHIVVFSGAPKTRFLDDSAYPFTANPHFVGWLPLTDTPHCYIVHTPGETPRLIYFQARDYWHTPPADPDGFWTAEFDVRVVHDASEIPRHLPAHRDNCVLIGEIDNRSHAFGIGRINPPAVMNLLHYARTRKTAYELDCLRAASLRSARGHRAAVRAFRAGKSEYDIHVEYCRAVRHTESELPYHNIIALNTNAAVLHYQCRSRAVPAALHSFLIDAGAVVNGYASDITRTYAYDDGEFAALVERMDALQQGLVAAVREDVDFVELHLAAHLRTARLLKEFELAAGSEEALVENGVTAAFYPHGLGHFLGLQVHDVGGYMADESGTRVDPPDGHPFLRLTRTLQADQVLTIEPGLYAIDMLQRELEGTPAAAMVNGKRVAWLRRYGGVRIEDNVRVLPDGCENMTRDAFGIVDRSKAG